MMSGDAKIRIGAAAWCVLLLACTEAVSAANFTVTLTTNVLVRDVMPLGINISDSSYDAPTRAKRWEENFEGTVYRQIHPGLLFSNGFASVYGSTNQFETKGWNGLYPGATWQLVSDTAPMRTGTVVSVTPRYIVTSGTNAQWSPFFDLGRGFPEAGTSNLTGVGLMVERLDQVGQGHIGARGNYWISGNCDLATNQPAPNTFGSTSLRMDGTSSNATYRTATLPSHLGDLGTGAWTLSFSYKVESGSPNLQVASRYSGTQPVHVTPTWSQTQQVWTVASRGSSEDREEFVLTVSSGVVLVDDVQVWQNSETNGTAYRTDFVELMRSFNVGLLRQLQMGGASLSNMLYPPLHQHAYAYSQYTQTGPYGNAQKSPYGVHEFLQLCETVGAEPWLNLPGILHTNEVAQFMEYLAGPTNVGWGRIRGALGHPAPWTDGRPVNIEFGNEAWNLDWSFLYGGFNGTNYWRRLVQAGKGSPYYVSNILFHAAGQNFDGNAAKRIMRDVTNADHYAIAPYALQSITTNDTIVQNTPEKLFQWMLNAPLYDVYTRMLVHNELITNGTAYSIYEFNYHTTSGDSPVDVRNAFLTSKAAAVGMANTALLYLKEYGIRRQCLFTLNQEAFSANNGLINLWGMSLSFKKDAERQRPHWLAHLAVNKVRAGDLVATTHSTNVTQTTYGRFSSSDTATPTSNTYPAVFSYGFRNGLTNGLILVNYSLTETQDVQVVFGEAASLEQATSWVLTSPTFTNHNEWSTSTAQVALVETTLTAFVSGSSVAVPPCSLRVLRWKTAGPGEDFRPPELVGLDPVSGTTNAEVSHILQMTFNEKIEASNGYVRIYTASNGVPVYTLATTGDAVAVNGQTASILPPTNLAFSTAYYILVDTNAFFDLAGNAFTGITATSSWTFTTREMIPPTTNILRIDFGLTNAPVETDGGWQEFPIPFTSSSKATNLTFLMGASTVTVSVSGVNLSGRDRANPSTDAGALTYASVYRDLFQATSIMTVSVTGVKGDAGVSVRVWMYDYSFANTNILSLTDVTDGRSDWIGVVTNFTGTSLKPTNNTAYSVAGEIWASSAGGLVFNLGGNSGVSRLNGLELVQISGDVPPVIKTLDIVSPHGQSTPPPGLHSFTAGARLTCAVTNTPFLLAAGTQLVCLGYTGTGSAPSDGSETGVTFTLMNNSTLTWRWETNLRLNVAAGLNGSVSESGWVHAGHSATVSATALRGYQFAGWTGDLPTAQTNDNPLILAMTQARSIAARFEAAGPVATGNCPIVDFGAKIGSGYYRGQTAPRAYAPLVDQDNNGTLTNDTVSAWIFSLDKPLNAPGLEFDTNSPSGVFYGGLTSYATDNPNRSLSEGMVNQNHEFYDDLNMMGLGDIIPGEKVRAFGLWFWQKQDFLNGADDYVVRFDNNSVISVYISRYWGGVNAGRWLVREGDQFYLSRATFAGKTNQYDNTTTNRVDDPGDGASNPLIRKTHSLNPHTTSWAPYSPGGAPGTNDDFEIAFDADTASFSTRSFSNVTAVGFLVERKLSTPYTVSPGLLTNQPMGVKWNAFRCNAVVERPADPSFHQPTAPLNGGAFALASNQVPYALWRKVFRHTQRRPYMGDLGSRTYSYERDGAMGTMRADEAAHTGLEPAREITWLDAIAFCNGLSELEGLTPSYYSDATMTNVLRILVNRDIVADWATRPTVYWKTNAPGFRLPTAREWEQMTTAMRATDSWEYVWHPTGTIASPAAQTTRTVRAWNQPMPTSSVLRFTERPWQGSPRIGFRFARNGTAAPDLAAPSGVSTTWTFHAQTSLAPAAPLSDAQTRALITPLLTLVPLEVGLAQGIASSDTNFIPSSVIATTPVLAGFAATEVPFKLWDLVQAWGRDHGYGFNYDGDMGSMGNTPGAAAHTNMEPVTELSLYDTYAWCNALSELMGREPVYHLDAAFTQVYRQATLFRLETLQRASSPNWPGGPITPYDTAALIPVYLNASANGYRIPLPQEWALADATDANSAADAYNWLIGNAGGKTQPVGTKLPNPLGLYDMEGNALELSWGSPKANINNAPWRLGSHFARASQIGKNPAQTSEFAGVGRAHVGFRVMAAIAQYTLLSDTNNLNIPEGSSATFHLSLSAPPDATVTVSVSRISGDADLAITSGATLLFSTSNWAVAQGVTIAAAEDGDALNGTALFHATAENLTPVALTANELDNEGSFTVSPTSLTFVWSASSGNSTTVLFSTGFEGSTNLPSGWTQQWVAGPTTIKWLIQRGGYTGGSYPATAHGGSNNACLYYGGRSNVTQLISPAVSSGNATSVLLSFWHTQPYWNPDQDQLWVRYRTNGAAWITLMAYTNNVTSWTQRTLAVPAATNLQLCFEGLATWGYGASLDDISLTSVAPAAGGLPSAQIFTVSNSGPVLLLMSNTWPASWLEVLPSTATLTSGQSVQFSVGIVSNSLQPGLMTSLIWVASSGAAQAPAPVTINFTVDTNFASHLLSVGISNAQWGTVNTTGGLYIAGCPVSLKGTPAEHGLLTGWTGTVVSLDNPLQIAMSTSHTVKALFAERLFTNGTPSSWLASNGFPISDVGALQTGANGMEAWESYTAGVAPQIATTTFKVVRFNLLNAGQVVTWPSVTGRTYALFWSPAATGPFTTTVAEALTAGVYTDALHGADDRGFYQLRVRLEP